MSPSFARQTDQPLFPEIFWDRPTTRSRGGRLLIAGGQRNEFSAVQAIYQVAEAAGIGEGQVVLPDSLRRLVGEAGFARFVPASASGSLGKAALGQLLHLAADFDGMVLGGNLTNNSETAVMVESLIRELDLPVVVSEEAIEILKFAPALITGNPKVLVVTTMVGLFALANHHHLPLAIKPHAGVMGKLEILAQLAAISRCAYLVFDQEVMVAAASETSLSALDQPLSKWPAAAIGVAATFWLQQHSKPFAALTTAAFVLGRLEAADMTTYAGIAAGLSRILRAYEQ
jgi:hypothetical protein